MKRVSILLILISCVATVFAQEEATTESGKKVILSSNGTWYYKPITGSMKDSRDGKTYKTVSIGTQVWMAQNLNYQTSNSWCYNDSSSNGTKYGRLYTWRAAQNACPSGWHLPNDNEWTELTNYLGGESVVGKKLKSASGWDLYEGKNYGNNESGFSACPGGYFDYGDSTFKGEGKFGNWWSSTPYGNENAWLRYLYYDDGGVGRYDYNCNDGYSVRCVKD